MSSYTWDIFVTPVLFDLEGPSGASARRSFLGRLDVEVLVDVYDQVVGRDILCIHGLLEDLGAHQPVDVALIDLDVALAPLFAGLVERPLLGDGLEQGRVPV